MAQTYAAKYLAKAAMSAPRDFVRAAVAKYTPLHPTVFIFHCTFVCDARCEMCSNWTRGNRKEDMTLAQIERVFSSNLWKDIENASISGGEPTTRNDLVEIARVMIDKFPKLRKLTLNTTGITHHRAIPMLTKIVELCNERNVIFSTRVSIDGVGDMHGSVRNVRNAFEKAGKTIAAMQELQKTRKLQLRHLVDDLLEEPRGRRQHPRLGEEGKARHRLQHGALHRRHAGQRRAREGHEADRRSKNRR